MKVKSKLKIGKMNAGHDLKNRYMHIDFKNESAVQSAKKRNQSAKMAL